VSSSYEVTNFDHVSVDWGMFQVIACDWLPPAALVMAVGLLVTARRSDLAGTARPLVAAWLTLALPFIGLIGPHGTAPVGWIWYGSAAGVTAASLAAAALTVADRRREGAR